MARLLFDQPLATFVLSGSVPSGAGDAGVIELALRDAIQRGFKFNLGVLTNQDEVDVTAADRRRALSVLLPNIYGGGDAKFPAKRSGGIRPECAESHSHGGGAIRVSECARLLPADDL